MAGARIGFMQGRLSPQVDGKIQAFPWVHWRDEQLVDVLKLQHATESTEPRQS